MNQHDSEYIDGILKKESGIKVNSVDEADIIVINTCSVRESAENKIIGFIDSLKSIKRSNPELIIAVIGCMVSKEDLISDFIKKHSHVNIVLGTRNIHKLLYYIELSKTSKGPHIEVNLKSDIPERLYHNRECSYKTYLTIMYGCDNFCSYCIVPYVRGREISRNPENIIKEAKELVADGVKEITLLGQNVNSYGKSLLSKYSFSDLIIELNKIDGLERIRYMTSHPKDFNDEIIDAIYKSEKVCRHFHLPFQAGSNYILSKMNRYYNREYYLDLIQKIKSKFTDYTLTTDIIVGFPGETEDDFLQTIDILKTVEFDNAYTFLYSPRKGTPAAKSDCQIPDEVKKDRLSRLMNIQNEISLRKNINMIGKTYSVLCEGKSKNNVLMNSGRTDGNKLVHFPAKDVLPGEIVQIEITDAHTWSLTGKLL